MNWFKKKVLALIYINTPLAVFVFLTGNKELKKHMIKSLIHRKKMIKFIRFHSESIEQNKDNNNAIVNLIEEMKDFTPNPTGRFRNQENL